MTQFPDGYKKRILQHSEDILEIARVLAARNPDLTLAQCMRLVEAAQLDATISLIFSTISINIPKPAKK